MLELGRLEPGESTAVGIEYEGQSVDANANLLFTVTSAEEVSDTAELTARIEPNGEGDLRGTDPDTRNTPTFDTTPQIPFETGPGSNSGSGSDSGGGEPQIVIPQDNAQIGQTGGLLVQIQSAKTPVSPGGSDEAPVRFRVVNNDTFPHENVDISIAISDGISYSNFDPGTSPLQTINQLSSTVRQVDFGTRRTLRPGESLEGLLYVTGRTAGQHPIQILTRSDSTGVLSQTDFVNVSQ